MKSFQIIQELITLANQLDQDGKTDLADLVDQSLQKLAQEQPQVKTPPTTHTDSQGVIWTQLQFQDIENGMIRFQVQSKQMTAWKDPKGLMAVVPPGYYPDSAYKEVPITSTTPTPSQPEETTPTQTQPAQSATTREELINWWKSWGQKPKPATSADDDEKTDEQENKAEDKTSSLDDVLDQIIDALTQGGFDYEMDRNPDDGRTILTATREADKIIVEVVPATPVQGETSETGETESGWNALEKDLGLWDEE